MKCFTVYPEGAEHAIKVRAETEARARLTAAIWYLTTPLYLDVLRPFRVIPVGGEPNPLECVNDENLKNVEDVLTRLLDAARSA